MARPARRIEEVMNRLAIFAIGGGAAAVGIAGALTFMTHDGSTRSNRGTDTAGGGGSDAGETRVLGETITAEPLLPTDAPAPPAISGPARATLTAVRSHLQSLTPTESEDLRGRVGNAIVGLEDALVASLWVGTDGNHIDPDTGTTVFTGVRLSVTELASIKSPQPSWVSGDIGSLIGAARLIATVAINDNICDVATAEELRAAQNDVTSGDAAHFTSAFASSVGHYGSGWQHALATSGAQCSFAVSGTVTGLYPGSTLALALTLTNRNNFPITVNSVSIAVAGASATCPASNLTGGALSAPVRVAANSSSVGTLPITMARSAPDACQGATFPLAYTAEGVKA
jgi:hypothetical protein